MWLVFVLRSFGRSADSKGAGQLEVLYGLIVALVTKPVGRFGHIVFWVVFFSFRVSNSQFVHQSLINTCCSGMDNKILMVLLG